MLNETLFLLSFNEIKNLLLNDLTVFHVAIVYILMYVIYKAMGRYIYFKPQEHASKINRTFLVLSLFTFIIHGINGFTKYLPFLPEYRWFYTLCMLIIFIAPLSILMDKIIWKYDDGNKNGRRWSYDYLPISRDYYKTNIYKHQGDGNRIDGWEEEGVESTIENIHSDALLNILAVTIFIILSIKWANNSIASYGILSYIFSVFSCLTITGIFLDRAVFSWIKYSERKVRVLLKKR